jgi:hypothetical protein
MISKNMLENVKITFFRAIFIFISVFIFFNILQNSGDYLLANTKTVDTGDEATPVISITPEYASNIPVSDTDNNIDIETSGSSDNIDSTDSVVAAPDDAAVKTEPVSQESPVTVPPEPGNTEIKKPESNFKVDITPVNNAEKQNILNDINELPLSQFTLDNYSDLYKDTLLTQTEAESSVYLDDLYLIGDSITKGLWEYELFPKERIYAEMAVNVYSITRYPIVETAPDVKIKVTEALKQTKPHKIIITLGINELGWMTPKQFIGYYSKFIDQIFEATPDSTIILQSISPIKKDKETIDFNNRKINYFNFLILELAESKGILFLNSCQTLKDENGYLPDKYDDGDGIHISKKAYIFLSDKQRS